MVVKASAASTKVTRARWIGLSPSAIRHRSTVEDSLDQRGDPEGYGQKQHHPPEEDGDPEGMTDIRVARTARVTAYSDGI